MIDISFIVENNKCLSGKVNKHKFLARNMKLLTIALLGSRIKSRSRKGIFSQFSLGGKEKRT